MDGATVGYASAQNAKMPERDKYDCEVGKHILAIRRAIEMVDQLNGSIGRTADRVVGHEPPTPASPGKPDLKASPNGLLAELQEEITTLGAVIERGQYLAGRLSNLG